MFRRKVLLIGSLLIYGLLFCSPSPDDYAEFKGGEPCNLGQEIIFPFKMENSAHRMTVEAGINGQKLDMIFDTGGQTFLEKNLKDSLDLDTFVIPANQAEFSVIDTISLGALEVYGMKAGLIEFEDTFKLDLKGMIGSDLLRFFQIKLDYDNQEIRFCDPAPLTKMDRLDHLMDLEIIFPYMPTVKMDLVMIEYYPVW